MNQKEKTLNDFPEYVRINDKVQSLRRQEQELIARIEALDIELRKPKREINGQNAWERALELDDTYSFEIDTTASLREERTIVEGQLKFIREALSVSEIELDKVRGQFCLEICKAVRPAYTKQVERILVALMTISDANAELQRIRDELERQGVTAGSLPAATSDLGGTWNDRYGGRLVGYQKYIAEHFPELATVAGQSNQNRAA